MADIRVEKKGNSGWLWILGIIAAILVIWIVFALMNDDRNNLGAGQPAGEDGLAQQSQDGGTGILPGDTGVSAGGSADLPDPVRDFSRFVQERRIEQAMGAEHEATSQGIQQLSAALEAVAENRDMKDDTFQARADSMENAAEQLKEEAQSANHANLTRSSLLNAAQLMEGLGGQAAAEAGESIRQFRQSAESLDAGQPLLDQKEEISNAFNQADKALRELARG